MSEKFPRITADELIKILLKLGFILIRQSGSHKIYKNDKSIRLQVLIILAKFYVLNFGIIFA
ncbi:MAG: type II toxin-antitoxin system HicA family toxin [Hydrogenothermaceae bacterium]